MAQPGQTASVSFRPSFQSHGFGHGRAETPRIGRVDKEYAIALATRDEGRQVERGFCMSCSVAPGLNCSQNAFLLSVYQ